MGSPGDGTKESAVRIRIEGDGRMMSGNVRARLRTAFILGVFATACAESNTAPSDVGPRPGVLQLEHYNGVVTNVEGTADLAVRWTLDPVNVVAPPRVIVVPDTVDAGAAFDVTVFTIGESGCWSAAGQEVTVSGRLVEMRPYDVHSGAEICTLVLGYLRHGAVLRLEERGEWVIRVHGRRARHGDDSWEAPVSVEKTVVVR
jgi:hypothetical protein